MLYSALVGVSSTMGVRPSGNPPLCLLIMFVLQLFAFAFGDIKYSSPSHAPAQFTWIRRKPCSELSYDKSNSAATHSKT